MVGRLFRTLTCFSYKNGMPTLRLKLMNYLGDINEFNFILDTGFSGGIMMPKDEYEFFTCGEIPQSLWRTYTTLTGVIPMRTAKAFVIVDEAKLKFDVYVETPVYGVGKRLVGREVISRLVFLLNGPESNCCLCEEYLNKRHSD